MNKKLKIFGVLGKPVLHSKSPHIFDYLSEKAGYNGHYLRINSPSCSHFIEFAKRINMSGFNVTSPYKEGIIPLLDKLDKTAIEIGAVNTVKVIDGEMIGYNTDWYGVVMSFISNGIDINGKECVVLGAGGAAKAAVYGLKKYSDNITIINRTEKKAKELSKQFECKWTNFNNLKNVCLNADIIVNTIPEFELGFDTNAKILSADYRNENNTELNGVHWLYYQAIKSFEIFTDIELDEPFDGSIFNNDYIRNRIAFSGYMGVGKSVLARIVSNTLSLPSVDTDTLIEKISGEKISDIIEKNGIDYFRKIETEACFKAYEKNSIISLGGGSVTVEKIRELLKECTVFWVYRNLEEYVKTLSQEKRPLFSNDNFISLFNERLEYYAKTSDIVIISDKITETVKRVTDEILQNFTDIR